MADSYAPSEPIVPPGVIPRPALAQWLFDRNLGYADFAARLGVTKETVRLLCLPFSHKGRLRPGDKLASRILDATAGDIRPASFHVPRLVGSTS